MRTSPSSCGTKGSTLAERVLWTWIVCISLGRAFRDYSKRMIVSEASRLPQRSVVTRQIAIRMLLWEGQLANEGLGHPLSAVGVDSADDSQDYMHDPSAHHQNGCERGLLSPH